MYRAVQYRSFETSRSRLATEFQALGNAMLCGASANCLLVLSTGSWSQRSKSQSFKTHGLRCFYILPRLLLTISSCIPYTLTSITPRTARGVCNLALAAEDVSSKFYLRNADPTFRKQRALSALSLPCMTPDTQSLFPDSLPGALPRVDRAWISPCKFWWYIGDHHDRPRPSNLLQLGPGS